MMSDWQPIETAPKDGTVIDVWLEGEMVDIEFYCQQPPRVVRRGKGIKTVYGGRAAGWMWLNDKWRPFLPGLGIPVFIQPLMWMPIPDPPERS